MSKEQPEQLKFVDSRRLPVRIGLVFAIFFALVFAWLAVRWQIGNMLAEFTSTSASNVITVAEFSAAFAPGDPMSNWFLASSERDVFTPEKRRASLEKYETVVRLAPSDYRWWIELGRAREQAEDITGAEAAFRRAVELAPAYTYPHWQAGNFYLRQGDTDKAFAELQKASENNPVYRQQVFSTIWDYFDKDTARLEQLAGDAPNVRADLALFYASKERAPDALRVWNTLTPEQKKENESDARIIAQALFEKKYFRSAVGFTRELGFETEAEAEKIQNAGFESSIGRENDSYFSWKVIPTEKVDVRLDSSQKRGGNRSLRIVFNGYTGAQYSQTYQIVAVEPNAKYRLTFWRRSENLKSAGNPLIEIVNANDDRVIKTSEAFPENAAEWQEVKVDFVAPPNAEGVVVRAARAFCGNQCPLFGSIWLDDFSISKQ
ncbi:MAG TPA: carbohydrate binding domain-containing protein [Pyrinomonadaceae bacterium]|nr:carbohydrate binding domain-containing protein [Pyrinomonadaceae bacterium]